MDQSRPNKGALRPGTIVASIPGIGASTDAVDANMDFSSANRRPRKPIARSSLRADFVPLLSEAEAALKAWARMPTADAYSAPFQVVDLFSGCGGMSLGFSAFGRFRESFEIVGACDIDAEAARTFEANLGAPCVVADVSEVSRSKARVNKLLAQFPRYDPRRQTVLIGCAPCQGFSSHRKKSWDKPDPRNSLPVHFARIAKAINPSCIVMENVPEMLSSMYWAEFNAARKILKSAGYVVRQAIYNAAEFGVPQERFRAVVIAMKRQFTLPRGVLEAPRDMRTVRQAIGHLPPVKAGERIPTDPLHYSASHKHTTLETIKAVPKNGGSRPVGVGPKCLDRIKGFFDVYGRLHWDRPSITITHYARNPASGRFVHPDQDRGLTIRECAELQSFPRGFCFSGKSDDIYKQIGEAVPPLMSLAIATHLFVELQSSEPDPDELDRSPSSIESPVSNSFSSVIAGIKMGRRRK